MLWRITNCLHLLYFTTLFLIFNHYAVAQVFELNLQNFDQFTKDKDVMLIEFFAPWCHHCQELQPEWEKAASALAVNREFILGKSDCIGNGKDLCDRFSVQMYPTIKLFRHGVFQEDYNGDRNADAIIKYLQQAQSQIVANQAFPQGPSNDPWQTGASFQYAYPMTTQPMNPTIQAPKPYEPIVTAPVKPFAPPEVNQWAPVQERAEAQPFPGPPAANGNSLWNVFNSLWNQNNYKPPAPSLFQSAVSSKPAITRYEPLQPQSPQQRQPETLPIRTNVASSFLQYNSNNNLPFRAQATAYQVGFQNPPASNLVVPARPVAGTYQGLLDASNNGLGTSFIVIDGKPYAIRRVINRYNNAFTPGNLNFRRFQPFPRFGPGFIRGATIPHIVRQALGRQGMPRTPPQRLIANPKANVSPNSPQSVTRAQVAPALVRPSRPNQPTVAAPRFHVSKPNYMQMYSDYLRALGRSNLRSKTLHPIYKNRPNPAANRQALAPIKPQVQFLHANNFLNPGRKYAVSIKGTPGSSALEAIRNKAVTNPGFLSGILSGRSQVANRQRQPPPQFRQNYLHRKYQINVHQPSLANLPQTDRALIRTKIIRPFARPSWTRRNPMSVSPRAKIVYMPQSAFKRLPTWYRPKIGPALVKYVVKTKGQSRASFTPATANKKQVMIKPPVQDFWRKIYNYYNRKNSQIQPIRQIESAQLSSPAARGTFALPEQRQISYTKVTPTVSVGNPIYRVRSFQKNLNIRDPGNLVKSTKPTFDITQFLKKKQNGNNFVPPDLWDKRSRIRSFLISKKNTIPHRPTVAGNWGTLKKRRSAAQGLRRELRNKNNDNAIHLFVG